MTLTLDLTEDEQSRLKEKADRLGLDEVAFLKRVINEPSSPAEPLPQTPAEAIAYWERVGVLGTFADRPDSPEFARQLREEAGRRTWS